MRSFRPVAACASFVLSALLVWTVVATSDRGAASAATRNALIEAAHRRLFDVLETRAQDPPGPPDAWGLHRERLPEELAHRILHRLSYAPVMYDADAFFRWRPEVSITFPQAEHPDGRWTITTDALGLRGGGRTLHPEPDLRVLVVGDSQTEGYCNDDETYAVLVETALRRAHPGRAIEVLNASCGGYSFYHHLGALERLLDLRPDLFVHAVYGGNDFAEVLGLHHYFERIPPPADAPRMLATERERGAAVPGRFRSAGITQLHLFDALPEERELALDASLRVSAAVRARCAEAGIDYLCLYLPSLDEVQPERYPESHGAALELLGLGEESRASIPRLAEALLESTRAAGGAVLDLTAALQAADEDLFWHHDHHLNPAGHRRIAAALGPILAARVP